MKSAKYEATPGALAALLATRQFVLCDLYTITLAGSAGALHYTTADADVGYGGTVWIHGAPLFDAGDSGTRPTAHWKVGLDVDSWQVSIIPRPVDPITGAAFPDKIGAVPWLAAVRAGALDGAVVQVDRAYLAAWPRLPRTGPIVPLGVVNVFTGRVAAVDIGRTAAVMTVNSHLELLDTQMPRNLYQAGCRHALFDSGCTLAAASFAVAGAALDGSSALVIYSNISGPAGSGTYSLGRVRFQTGRNAGFTRSVRWWTAPAGSAAGSLLLLAPLPFPVAAGDSFQAWPGCDLSLGTCGAFGNTANFGGMPFIPPPETSV